MKERPPAAIGWNHPDTAASYRAFDRKHDRYRLANAELIAHAALGEGMRVLDLAAGLGGTARAALTRIGPDGRVVCLEPAAAMRKTGKGMLGDARVKWTGTWPRHGASFDRVLCGAAFWQLPEPAAILDRIYHLLNPGGALCFNIPSLYLGEPDEPGGGADPMLLALPAALASGLPVRDAPALCLPDAERMRSMLAGAGFQPGEWRFRLRMTQAAFRDWLRIPPLTDHLFAGKSAAWRTRRINAAYRTVDAGSWRWERWAGWTAWKPPATR